MKRFATLAAAVLAALQLSTAQAAGEVELQRGQSIAIGAPGRVFQALTFQAKVSNLAFHKEVYAHVKGADGLWTDIPLSFLTASESGKEVWSGNAGWFTGGPVDFEYVMRYVVNGQTYWDNNNGRNYRQKGDAGALLKDGLNVLNRYEPVVRVDARNTFSGGVTVRNLGVPKAVTVRFTTDDWRTQADVPARFDSVTDHPNPNGQGAEEWIYDIPVGSAGRVQLAVGYTVNGQTFWDNNGGRNYQVLVQRN